jgi:predicted nucleic acid-binding protein
VARSRPEPERFIVDNSVWARLSTSTEVRARLVALANLHSPTAIMICPPVAAEVGFSARSGADHDQVMKQLAAFPECPATPTSVDVLDMQNRLWNGGLLRSVGTIDTLIAAYGIVNDATVLHYDSDFEHLSSVTPGFKHGWIVAQGSVT